MNLVRSELVKLLGTRRTLIVLGLAMLAIVGLGTAGTVDSGQDGFVDERQVMRDVLTGPTASAALFALILGILVVTWEYQHGTITHTLLATPRRERVVYAKAAVAVVAGVVLAAGAAGVALAIAIPWLGSVPEGIWSLVGRVLLSAALWGALGVAIGSLVASQVAAIVGSLVWLLIVEAVIAAFADRVSEYLPVQAIAVLQGSDTDGLSAAGGFVLTVAYVCGLGALGLVATLRRDVT